MTQSIFLKSWLRMATFICQGKRDSFVVAWLNVFPFIRTAITKKIGQLFIMRINVNLVSNILDTPEIFWSEPALEPLYSAIRSYLEISQRVELLNQRVEVISDLLDMLKDHLNSSHGKYRKHTHTHPRPTLTPLFFRWTFGMDCDLADCYGNRRRRHHHHCGCL